MLNSRSAVYEFTINKSGGTKENQKKYIVKNTYENTILEKVHGTVILVELNTFHPSGHSKYQRLPFRIYVHILIYHCHSLKDGCLINASFIRLVLGILVHISWKQ